MPGVTARSGGDRHSKNADPFPVDGLPEPLKELSTIERGVYRQLTTVIPASVLRKIDCFHLSQLSKLICAAALIHEQWTEKEDRSLYNDWLKTVAQIEKLGKLYGLSPKDRQGMVVETEEEDEDAEFFG